MPSAPRPNSIALSAGLTPLVWEMVMAVLSSGVALLQLQTKQRSAANALPGAPQASTPVITLPGLIGSGRFRASLTSAAGLIPSKWNIVADRSSGRNGSLAGYAPIRSDDPKTCPR